MNCTLGSEWIHKLSRVRRIGPLVIAAYWIFGGAPYGGQLHASSQDQKLRVLADAFVSGSWNGILFVVDDATGFQVRVGTRAEGGDLLDGDHGPGFLTGLEERMQDHEARRQVAHPARDVPFLYSSVTEVGPHAPDGSYARLRWNPLYPLDTGSRIRLEWARLDPATLVGRVVYETPLNYMSKRRTVDLILESFSPLGFEARYEIAQSSVRAESEYWPVVWEHDWNYWRFHFSSSSPELQYDQEPGHRDRYWSPQLDDSDWTKVRWGAYWQEDPVFLKQKGYGWYRIRIAIPGEARGKILRLKLHKVTEDDWTYLNGELVGHTEGKEHDRVYRIEPGTAAYRGIKWGTENTLAVQVRSAGEFGGISSGPHVRYVRLEPPLRPSLAALESKPRTVNFVLLAGDDPDDTGTYADLRSLRNQIQQKWRLGDSNGQAAAALLFYDLHNETHWRPEKNHLYFAAKVGLDSHSELHDSLQQLMKRQDLGRLLQERQAAYEAQRVRIRGGFGGTAEWLTNTGHWARLYSPEQKRSFVADSRRWFLPDSWTLFANSAVLTSWAVALEDQAIAEDTLRGILAEALPDGRVMNATGKFITTPDRSQGMYAAYAAWKIYQKWGNKQFLRDVYPAVSNWHNWWFADRGDGQAWRDGNGDGLLELGCNMSPFDAPQPPRDSFEYGLHHQGAMWESYDDSPMWGYYTKGISVHPRQFWGEKGVNYVFRTSTLNLNTLVANSMYALSADMLVRIARELGYTEDESVFREQYRRIRKLINEHFWDPETGTYRDRFWKSAGGHLSSRKSPVMFYTMAAGVPTREQADRLVYEHMLNPKEFWGEWVLPTISRDDPAYAEQYYWRGTIWPTTNLIPYEGLKRYGYDDVAAQLADKTYRLLKKNWQAHGGLYENYNSMTGEGDPKGRGGSTIHYAWSTSLAIIPVMECIDQEAWGGLRFGSLGLKETTRIRNFPLRGHIYDAIIGADQTELQRDGKTVFVANTAAVVREFEWSPTRVRFRIKTPEDAADSTVTVSGLELVGDAAVVRLDGQPVARSARGSSVSFLLPVGSHLVEIDTTMSP